MSASSVKVVSVNVLFGHVMGEHDLDNRNCKRKSNFHRFSINGTFFQHGDFVKVSCVLADRQRTSNQIDNIIISDRGW